MLLVSKDDFIEYLRKEGYSEWSDAGNPTTISHYVYWIEKIMENEHIPTWSELTDHIQRLLREYGEFGKKKYFGDKEHKTVINGLKRFMEYLLNERGYVLKKRIWYL